jgi:hypothetical protein
MVAALDVSNEYGRWRYPVLTRRWLLIALVGELLALQSTRRGGPEGSEETICR